MQNLTIAFVVLIFFFGCSAEKNTFTSRAYHNLTAHYNVYFNGKESLKNGEMRIKESIEDDYTRLLPIYKSSRELTGTVASSDMDYAIEKGLKLIELHSIKKKPKKKNNASKRYKEFREKGEWNNWVDDAHLLIGKANFYKRQYFLAEVQFQHTARYYKGTPSEYIARIWMARTLIEQERLIEAKDVLEKLEANRDLPRQMLPELHLAWADLYMRTNLFEDAIGRLKTALESNFNRERKLRYYYILGQLYQETNQKQLASETFNKLVHMRPNYRMAFYARIQRAEMGVTEENFASLQKQLKRMLRDKKNKEFEDRIYYAFGNMYWEQGKKSEAIADFTISAARATEHPDQRAQSCLRLARIYFDQENYTSSQAYYDSASVVIDETYPNYDLITKRTKVLSELVVNLNEIQLQDSLQRMAAMPKTERTAMINSHINYLKEQEQLEKERERQRQQEQNYYRTNSNRLGQSTSNRSSWYFYNPTTVSMGKSEFQRIYGQRKLSDNWRRSDLSVLDFDSGFGDEEQGEFAEGTQEQSDSTAVQERVDDRMNVAFYTQDLPLSDSLMMVSDAKIQEAYYNAARIMRLDLQNIDQATKLYDELLRRYPKGSHELVALFDRYDIALSTNDIEDSNQFRERIVMGYPESKYAAYIKNPNFFTEQQALRDSTYKMYSRALDAYYKREFARADAEATRLMEQTSDTLLLPKAAFIQTVARGTEMALVDFETNLHHYLEQYPEGETAMLAEKILMLVRDRSLSDMDQMLASGYVNETIVNQELKASADIDDGFGGKWDYTEEVFHYYVLLYPKKYGIDINRLIFDMAHFNIDYYPEDDFDIEQVALNNQYDMVVIRSLRNREEALIYFNSIIRRREVFSQFEGREYVNFISSSNNYRTMLGDQDYREYNRFFMKNMSRYTGRVAPTSQLDDPMELLRKARQRKEEPQGDFVVIDTGSAIASKAPAPKKDEFSFDATAPHNFVLLVPKVGTNLKELQKRIEAFNKANFGSPNIKVETQRYDANRIMVTVTGLGAQESAMVYTRKFVRDRSLYEPITKDEYLNFCISTYNKQILTKKKDEAKYLDFYMKNYLKK